MKPLLRRVRRFCKWMAESPHMQFAVGSILLVTSLFEAWETLYEDLKAFNLGGHHGLIIYGLYNMLKNLPELFEGIEYITVAEEAVVVQELASKVESKMGDSRDSRSN